MGVKHKYGAVGRGDTLSFMPETLKVITDPKHPLYDSRVERKPSEAMIVSIMRDGIIEPLVITRDGDDVYVVDGRQRRAATIEANKRLKKEGGDPVLCPCVWRRADEAKLYEISVSANELRSGDSPLERARKMQHLKNLGRDDRSLAVTFGCTVVHVRNLLALLECAPAVQRAVESGLAASVATELSKLPREEQAKRLEKMVKAGVTKGVSAQRAAKTGDTEARPRALSSKVRERVRHALSNGCTAELTFEAGLVAKGAAAVLAFVEGDEDALKAWPDVEAIAREALRSKKTEKGGDEA